MSIEVRLYERPQRELLLNLTFYSRRTHAHLDWHKSGVWLDLPEALVYGAWRNGQLVGFMGASAPLFGQTWLRLLAVHNEADPPEVLLPLWQALREELLELDVETVRCLLVNRWIAPYLPAMGFDYEEDVVTLYRAPQTPLPAAPQIAPDARIEPAYLEDLPGIMAVDHAAFDTAWRMTADDLRQAQRQSASASIARRGGRIVGYQISTRHHSNGHLARLAVHPAEQGQRLGAALLHNLIERFAERGVTSMTVNTQSSNAHSQQLYLRYGFRRNGFDLPVWHSSLR